MSTGGPGIKSEPAYLNATLDELVDIPKREQVLARELYQVTGSDPLVIAGTAAAVLAVAILACAVPAWRASRLHPMAALRV